MSQTQTEQPGDAADEVSAGDSPEAAEQEPGTVKSGADESETEESETDEGDVAADYLEELLDIVDLDGDIDIEIRGNRTFISVVAEEGADELDELVGSKGEVLDALQELTRLAVLTSTGHRTRLVLDIAGHRERRQDELEKLAAEAVAKVDGDGQDVHLEPMSAYERKIVHDAVAEAGLVSESDGEGKRRHVVVSSS